MKKSDDVGLVRRGEGAAVDRVEEGIEHERH